MTALPEGSVTGSREEARDSLIALWDRLWDATASGLEPAEVARMERRFHENIARLAANPGDRLWVNDDRTILVRLWESGQVEVAVRPDPGATWGPPAYLSEEKVA